MQDKKIVIVGDTPATYICGIYLYTANISSLIIKKDMNLDYKCSFVPGLEATKEEYNQKCYEQAKNMGIEISESQEVKITEIFEDEITKFRIEYDDSVIVADILVIDMPFKSTRHDNLFVVEDLLLEKEAIVVAGTGCTIAFEIKDIMH